MGDHAGRCRCGAVSYHCQGDPLDVRICHCRDCQYASGGPFAVVAYFPAAACEVSGETSAFAVEGSSGMTVTRRFCPRCGTPLFSALAELPELLFVKVGTLDHPEGVRPSGHIWCASMLPWAAVEDGLERLPGNPPL